MPPSCVRTFTTTEVMTPKLPSEPYSICCTSGPCEYRAVCTFFECLPRPAP